MVRAINRPSGEPEEAVRNRGKRAHRIAASSEVDYSAIENVRADILRALGHSGRVSATDLLDLAPKDTVLDGYEIVLNALDSLRKSGLIRRVNLALDGTSGGDVHDVIAYEYADQESPAMLRQRAMAFLASLRGGKPLSREGLSKEAASLLDEIISERKKRKD